MAKVKRERCIICKKPVMVQIFKGTGLCSELCRKERDNDTEPAHGTLDKKGKMITSKVVNYKSTGPEWNRSGW